MKKKIVCLAMLAFLLLGSAGTAYAEEYAGEDGWSVRFIGNELSSTFRSSDLSDTIHAIQPGDRVSVELTLENAWNESTDWYMTNTVLRSLEDSQKAAGGGAYTYILTYTDPQGRETVLYSSENVGGEKDSEAGEGLHEVTDALDEFFYLERLEPGEKAGISLIVELDGETQGNAYQDTLADLQMNFAVEKVSRPGTPPPGKPGEPAKPDRTYSLNTGDTGHAIVWSGAALFSGLCLLGLAAVSVRRRKGGRSHE